MNIFGSDVPGKRLKVSDHAAVVQVDQATGLVEFPTPGDLKKHLLPVFVDPEESQLVALGRKVENAKQNVQQVDEYWMPDKLCKICYKCELPFTMYRRRHHCRMCGQIFCNQCSSFYIEQGVVGQTVRCCRLCYDELGASYDQDVKLQLPLEKRINTRSIRRENGHSGATGEAETRAGGGSEGHENGHLDRPPPAVRDTSRGSTVSQGPGAVTEHPADRDRSFTALEQRANSHLNSIVHLLVCQSNQLKVHCDEERLATWESIIVKLVKEVVNYVDPDVRNGDSLDIRPYVKLKVIPGGSLSDNAFINGVVFRKNVSHKKMANEKCNPRLLLLGGGIEFQREDQKLSSLDTLIEQEDKYTEILVEKIMSLKPDIILVGRSVARRAQEILCSHNVVVMQSVKASLLERVSRMTGALMLPSTDHMIQRYGENCLGSCGRFWLRKILDNEGDLTSSPATTAVTIPSASLSSSSKSQSLSRARSSSSSSKAPLRRITDKQKSTTYAYLEGCPPELGCTLILRGGNKTTLVEIKRIMKFSVMLAYHLRLEVAYYSDRCGRLPPVMNTTKSGYESEDDLVEEWRQEQKGGGRESKQPSSSSLAGATTGAGNSQFLENPVLRSLLSTSFDVDIKKPYQDEVRFDAAMNKVKTRIFDSTTATAESAGSGGGHLEEKNSHTHTPGGGVKAAGAGAVSHSPEDHQTLLVTSLLMTRTPSGTVGHGGASGGHTKVDRTVSVTGDVGTGGVGGGSGAGGVQRSRAEVKGIRFYTNQDVALGQFLIESCFQMHDRMNNNSVMMMDHTLSFIHRPGRIDISVTKLPQHHVSSPQSISGGEPSTSIDGGAATGGSTAHATAALVNLGVLVNESDSGGGHSRASWGKNDPLKAPIFLHSYCKECKCVVTPVVEISDETWKLSFGKFIEMNFYNHSARCRTGGCAHFLRDDHIMSFVCDGYMAQFEFVPIHPLSLHPRSEMPLPLSFHSAMIVNLINECVVQASRLAEDFAAVIIGLEKIVSHVLSARPEVLKALLNDIALIQQDIDRTMDEQADEVEAALQLILHNETPRLLIPEDITTIATDAVTEQDILARKKYAKSVLIATYPLTIRQEMLQKATFWNGKINIVYRFIDSVEGLNTGSAGSTAGAIGGGVAGGSSGVEHVDMPDEEDLLMIRSSVMGIGDADKDHRDHRDDSSSRGISGSSPSSSPRFSRHLLDSPRESNGDDNVFREEETASASILQRGEQISSDVHLPLPPLSSPTSEGIITDPSGNSSGNSSPPLPPPPTEPHDEGDDKIYPQRSISTVLNAKIASVNTSASATLSPTKDKSTRLTKAIQRFRGKGEHGTGHTAFAVGVEELSQGRLGLPPGRLGRVVAVHEEQLATVIAYSLASEEYYENLQLLQEEDGGGGLHTDSEKKRFTPFGGGGGTSKTRHVKELASSVHQLGGGGAESGVREQRVMRGEKGAEHEQSDISRKLDPDGEHDDDSDYIGDVDVDDDDDNDDEREKEEAGDEYVVDRAESDKEKDDLGKKGGLSTFAKQRDIAAINEEKTDKSVLTTPTRGNLTSPFNNSFRNIVSIGMGGGEDKEGEDDLHDNDHEEEEGHVGGHAVGHKSYKYLDMNYDAAMKVEGLAHVASSKSVSSDVPHSPVLPPRGDRLQQTPPRQSQPSTSSSSSGGSQPQKGQTVTETSLPPHSTPGIDKPPPQTPSDTASSASRESTLISQRKTHIKHRFNDMDLKTKNISCKFICHIFYATQFQAVRAEYLKDDDDDEGFIRSLSMADQWNAQGGKSGASFSKSSDSRFVVKHITRTELQMFLDFAPAYFEYLAKSFYHGLPTLLVKILGVYQLGYHNRLTGKRVMEQVVIMENLFYDRNITRIFDLKGSSRQRYVDIVGENGEKLDDFDNYLLKKRNCRRHPETAKKAVQFNPTRVCMDDNLMELTRGKPIPLKHKAKVIFHKAVMNDTLFLSIINIVDYSILVGIDEDTNELVVGIIDYMRQYDIIKRMERMGKSVGTMIAGQAEPTVIQPPQYRKRFQNAMERYFMTVPDKWIQNDI